MTTKTPKPLYSKETVERLQAAIQEATVAAMRAAKTADRVRAGRYTIVVPRDGGAR